MSKRNPTLRASICTAMAAAVVGGVLAVPVLAAAEEDAFVCMEESQEKCDRENENMGLFIKGRDALENGRESGDLSEARRYAAELMAREDLKHGKALMKFVYMQVSQGVHKNLVEAYRWVAADIAADAKYKRLDLQWVLDKLSARMTPEQLSEAKK
ncbi:MAG: hypothetical protein IPK20_06585 [Betaproteobacteria bacterium]|nr:hypothetical protein [Betaproteobacteria bacterium]